MSERVILAHAPDCDASRVLQMLGQHGFDTRSVHDGEGLLDLADSWRPEAAVIELGLRKRPALAAGSALRNWFGGDVQLVGFTIPSDPDAEKHALDAGFDHVVVDVGNAAEILLALSGPGGAHVNRARESADAFARVMIDHARLRLRQHASLGDPHGRRRNVVMIRRTIETINHSLRNAGLDRDRAQAMRGEVMALETQFERLVRSADGHAAP